jgi:hypothetical protein
MLCERGRPGDAERARALLASAAQLADTLSLAGLRGLIDPALAAI